MYKIWRRLGLGLLKTFDIVEKNLAGQKCHAHCSYSVAFKRQLLRNIIVYLLNAVKFNCCVA